MNDNIENDKLDFAKLLGFETVSDQLTGGVDFSDGTVGAKLGAKVGEVNRPHRPAAAIERG